MAEDIIRTMADCVIVVNRQGNIKFANASALKLLGYKLNELINRPLTILISEKFSPEKESFVTGRLRSWEGRWKTAQGAEIAIAASCTSVKDRKGIISSFVYIAKDISNLKKSEDALLVAYRKLKETREQLVQNEKMAVIGKLAGGIAHEIRNPLAIIVQGVYLLNSQIPPENKDSHETITMVKDAVTRVNDIITRLLEYARTPMPQLEQVSIQTIIEEGLAFAEAKITGKNIEITKGWPAEPMMIDGDKNTLAQVFAALIFNSIEAMPAAGGAIVIKVTQETDFCRIDFSDTGIGIADKDLPHVFEPFFTTKLSTKNSGLGLPLAQLIVEHHKGIITITSGVGRGTTVIIKLPLVR